MKLSVKQIGIVLWKNFRVMRGRQFLLVLEISIPLIITFLLLFGRMTQKRTNASSCYLREKVLTSLGIIPYLRDFICNIKTSCKSQPEVNWNDTSENLFLPLLIAISELYRDLPNAPYNVFNMGWWALGGYQVRKIQSTKKYFDDTFGFLFEATGKLSSNNTTEYNEGFETLTKYACGTQYNDIGMIMSLLKKEEKVPDAVPSDEDETPPVQLSCQESIFNSMKNDLITLEIYRFIAPLLFGKIYYTPNSEFTRELVKRANKTFALIDSIRLAAIQWRVKFLKQLEYLVEYNEKYKSLRHVLWICHSWGLDPSGNCKSLMDNLHPSVMKEIFSNVTPVMEMVEKTLDCAVLDKFHPLNFTEDIDKLENIPMTNIFAAVVFDESTRYMTAANANVLQYTIRMSTNRIDSTKDFKVWNKFWTPNPRTDTGGELRYYSSGFLLLQEAIDHGFIEMITNSPPRLGTSVQIMPYPCYQDDLLAKFLPNILPFFYIIAWAPSFMILLQNIVYEKEKRLKQFMCIMGLSSHANWVSRFLSTFLVQIIPVTIIALVFKISGIFHYSSFFLTFTVMISFVISYICQAFMISVVFDNTNLATVSGGILYFIFYLPFLVFVNSDQDLAVEMYYGWRLFSQVSFCNAINFILYWEQSSHGSEFPNVVEITKVNLYFEIWHCIMLIWMDSLLYIFLTWYVGSVFPGRYGIPKPWYFIFTKQFTFSFLRGIHFADNFFLKPIEPKKPEENNPNFEDEPKNLRINLSIQRLVKVYFQNTGPVIDDLNLNIYESHITALVGHNGAGKTTVISVLTGLIPPTSGTAFIMNLDIRKNIKEIRRNMGFCPQHNILFNNLTVEDHIYFYGLLKGIPIKTVKNQLTQLLRDAGLFNFSDTLVKRLSFGMKRKLSIAISFIGDSKIVILDEPTVGVDPSSRRQIWDVILNYRTTDKSIILITQDMDETDYLSDRVAIMVQGKLRCCGSPMFLKRKFGEGYKLSLFKNPRLGHTKPENGISSSGQQVYNYVKSFISSAIFTEETNTQWNITFPQNKLKSSELSKFFKDLDVSFKNFNILTYSLSDASLEDVFLKILDDPILGFHHSKTNEGILDFFTNYYNYLKIGSFLSLDDKSILSEISIMNYQSLEIILKYDSIYGFPLISQQVMGLLIKRFHYTKRNFKAFMAEILWPIFMIFLIIVLINTSSPNNYQPSMTISPWLMLQNESVNLNTFIRRENLKDHENIIKVLYENYKSDLGESGIRCMNKSVFHLANFPCNFSERSDWKIPSKEPILLKTPDCYCNFTGYQHCPDNRSGGPPSPYRMMPSTDKIHDLTGYNLSDYLIKNFKSFIGKQFGGYQLLFRSFISETLSNIGGQDLWNGLRSITDASSKWSDPTFLNLIQKFFITSGERSTYARIWVQTQGYVSMPAYVNIFSNLLLRSALNTDISMNYGIVISTHPFRENRPDLFHKIINILFMEVSLDIFVIMGLSFIPASFVIFLIEERVTGFKRQQLVSGVNPYVYWVSNFIWDIVKYFISVIFVIVIFSILRYYSLVGLKNITAFFLLLLLYGFAIMPHMYPFSLFITTPSVAFVMLYVYNLLIGSITTIVTFATDQMIKENPNLGRTNRILKTIFLIFPQYSLGRGMMDLSFNYMQYEFSDGIIDYDPFAWNTTLEKLFALIGMSIIYWFILVLIISGIIKRLFLCQFNLFNIATSINLAKLCPYDFVDAYFKSKNKSLKEDNVLELVNLTKSYKYENNTPHVVISNIFLEIKEGECLGLIGVNGVGKTTLLHMLIGDETISKGDILINGVSIIGNIVQANKIIGFCPQFDALPSLLTCEELLFFYCRIRGVQSLHMEFSVTLILKTFGMLSQANHLTYTLSGGNKRKLSTAIALIGFPKIIILDDPTSCMDDEAKQIIWGLIRRLTETGKRLVLIATHNMKECEMVCDRIAIMSHGEIRNTETVVDLKSRCGNEYYVKLRIHPNRDRLIEKIKLKIIISREFGNAAILKDEKSIALTFRFTLVKLYRIFEFFENQKEQGLILDYSISQISIDDIFNSYINENFSQSDRKSRFR